MASGEFGILDTIRHLHGRDPFIPFRIIMTSGDGYRIENSALLAIGKSQVVYCFPHSDRVAHLRLNQIASVEELDLKAERKRKRA